MALLPDHHAGPLEHFAPADVPWFYLVFLVGFPQFPLLWRQPVQGFGRVLQGTGKGPDSSHKRGSLAANAVPDGGLARPLFSVQSDDSQHIGSQHQDSMKHSFRHQCMDFSRDILCIL